MSTTAVIQYKKTVDRGGSGRPDHRRIIMFGEWMPEFELKAKPNHICKVPYLVFKNKSENIDRYIRKSPILEYLDEYQALMYLVGTKHVTFMCTSKEMWEQVNKQFSQNVGFYPLDRFMSELEPATNKKKQKKINKLQQLLRRAGS